MRASVRIAAKSKNVQTTKIRTGLYVAKNRGEATVQFFGESEGMDKKPPAKEMGRSNELQG